MDLLEADSAREKGRVGSKRLLDNSSMAWLKEDIRTKQKTQAFEPPSMIVA